MSVLVAGKFEEREDRVPKLETLNSLGCMSSMNLVLTKQGLLHMELLLLETFQWNLYLPTAAHFIDYYLSIAVSEGDLHDGWPMTCLEKTRLYLAKYVDYFLEVSLQGELHVTPAAAERARPCETLLLLLPASPDYLHFCSSTPPPFWASAPPAPALIPLLPSYRSRLFVLCPFAGGSRVRGLLPPHPAPVPHVAAPVAAPDGLHLGQPHPLRREAAHVRPAPRARPLI